MTITRRTLIAGALGSAVLTGCSGAPKGTLSADSVFPAPPDAIRPFRLRVVGKVTRNEVVSPALVDRTSLVDDTLVVVRREENQAVVVGVDAATLKQRWAMRAGAQPVQHERELSLLGSAGRLVLVFDRPAFPGVEAVAYDRAGRILAPEVSGALLSVNGRWLVTREGGVAGNMFTVHEIVRS
ncbi:hypothetical protein IEE94_14325 [Yimella sp. cx-573]|nr:hypothetical protein [Yimella sp. cx-573]